MALSLVQEENWSLTLQTKEVTSKNKNEMLCAKHRGTNYNPAATLLVHLIDGFVIEESNVPFKQPDELKETQHEEILEKPTGSVEEVVANENEIIDASMNSYPEDRDELMSLLPTACKFCGEPLSEDRARWGKRFCSTSCSKKYSVNCSQRVKKALKRKTNATYARSKRVGETSSKLFRHRKRGRGRGYSRASSMDRIYEENIFDEDTEDQHSQTDESFLIDFNFPKRIPLGFGIEEEDIEEELFEGVETISKYSFIPAVKWSVTEVHDVILSIPGCESCAQKFYDEEIDGQALFLLSIEHMIRTMHLKLGPALKIASYIRSIKIDHKVNSRSKYLSSPLRS